MTGNAAGRPRIVLHTGKGGVGKTTMSAVTAIAAARSGRRVLALSTDPAHSLADVLGSRIGSAPTDVPGVPNLRAAQIDAMSRYERAWAAARDYLVGVLAARGLATVQAEEIVTLPGVDEVVALLEVRRLAQSANVDVVLVDCAPSSETLRLLALPETVEFYAGRFQGHPARLLRTVAASLAGIPAPPAPVRDAVGELLTALRAVRAMLADSRATSVRLVVTPESVVLAEARRLRTALALHGFGVDAVLANRIVPATARGAFVTQWRASQRQALRQIDESFGDVMVRRAPMMPVEPVGVPALTELAVAAFGRHDPLARGAAGPGMTVTAVENGYRLALPLPHADRGEVSLARAGDDLVITVGGQRRRLALPSTLRRCVSTGARFTGDGHGGAGLPSGARTVLLIDFAPDPARWPSALTDDAGVPRTVAPIGAAAERSGPVAALDSLPDSLPETLPDSLPDPLAAGA